MNADTAYTVNLIQKGPTLLTTLHYLSPLAKAGFVEPVDAGNRSSCHSAYRLTRKGRAFVKWH